MKSMFLFLSLLSCMPAMPSNVSDNKQVQADLNQTATGGYGYFITQDQKASVWWAEGAYKVLKDAPVPSKSQVRISLSAAKNEYESFIIVVNPESEMENFRISVANFTSSDGNTIPSDQIEIRKVEYVKVSQPTDFYGYKGYFPDPLPLYKKPLTLKASENTPLWITVHVPSQTATGQYTSEVTLTATNGWKTTIPVDLTVRNFELPAVPTIRSGWGMNMKNVEIYENLVTEEQKLDKFDKYMEMFSRYKISPYDPFLYAPIHETVSGVDWEGGFYDSKEKVSGNYGYKVVDNSITENIEAYTRELQPVTPGKTYELKWKAKCQAEKQTYVVGVECYDAEKNLIVFENRFEQFTANTGWKSFYFPLGVFDEEIRYIKVILCAANRTYHGEDKGVVWFDDLSMNQKETDQNLLACGNFEVELDKIDIQLDFSDFEATAKKYFAPPYNFNSFRLGIKGLGSGTYYSRQKGIFEGFEQGTEEYNKLMKRYLQQIQDNLERIGLLGKEYIYWFDEPSEKDYEFVYQTNKMIKEYAPKLTTFLTEHVAGQDISDVTDISCTIWHQLNHEKIDKMNQRGLEYWSYLCSWPKAPWISEFIDHDAVNMRMWLWASYIYRLKGVLMWETTYWNSNEASPKGYLQNPWQEAMSWVTGYGWPYGKQTIWGNGDGRFFYPENRNPNKDKTTLYQGYPIPSIRLEFLRAGIEDYEYMCILEKLMKTASKKQTSLVKEAKQLLQIPQSIYTDEKNYNKDPQVLLKHRQKIAELIEKFIK